MITNISKKEWIWIALVSILSIFLTTFPILYGYYQTPPDRYFTGIHTLSPGDYSVYFSYILQAKDGHFIFRDVFTHESQAHNILNSYWAVTGILANIFSLTPFIAFIVAKALSIPLLVVILYIASTVFFQKVNMRKIFLCFLLFSTGIGSYFEFFFLDAEYINGYYYKPMDLWVSESNIFLTMLHSGHIVMSLALTVLILIFFWQACEKKSVRFACAAGICLFVLLSFHPFQFPVIMAIVTSFTAFRCIQEKKVLWSYILYAGIMMFFSLPILLYYVLMLSLDPVTMVRAMQNINLTPSISLLSISFGFLGAFVLYGIALLFLKGKLMSKSNLFMLSWLAAQIVLIYFPLNYQRRLVEGLQIPVVYFAVLGIERFVNSLSDAKHVFVRNIVGNKGILFFIFLFFFCATNIYVLAGDVVLYMSRNPLAYISEDVANVAKQLSFEPKNKTLVLAEPSTAHFVPGITGRAVFAGHEIETLFYKDKVKQVYDFFRTNTFDEEKQDFLKKYSISHVLFGPQEREIGSFRPDKKPYLQKIFESGGLALYRFVR